MKRILFFLTLFVLSFPVLAQKRTLITDKAIVNDSIQIAGRWVKLVSADSTFAVVDHRSVPTTKAVRDFVLANAGSDTIYVLLGAGADPDTICLAPDKCAVLPPGLSASEVSGIVSDSLDAVKDTLTDLRSAITALQIAKAAILDSLNNVPDGSGAAGRVVGWQDGNTLNATTTTYNAAGFGLPSTAAISLPAPFTGGTAYDVTNGTWRFSTAAAWETPVRAANATGLGGNSQVGYFNGAGRLTSSSNWTFDGSNMTVSGTGNFGSNLTTSGRFTAVRSSTQYADFGITGSVYRWYMPSNAVHDYSEGKKIYVDNNSYDGNKLTGNGIYSRVAQGFFTYRNGSELESFAFVAGRNSGSAADSYLSLYSFTNTGATKSMYKDSILHILANSGFVGFGINPTQRVDIKDNIRVRGAYYDSSNSAGTSGQQMQSTGTGTKWSYGSYASNFGSTDSLILSGAASYKTIKTWNTGDIASADWTKTDSSLVWTGTVSNIPYEIEACVSYRAWTGSILELNLVSFNGTTNSIFSSSIRYKKVVNGAEDCLCTSAYWQSSTSYNRIKVRAGGSFVGELKILGGHFKIKQL